MSIESKLITLFGKFSKKNGQIKGAGTANPLHSFATTGNYSELSNKPTKLSQFTNDSGFVTSAQEANIPEIHGGLTGGPSSGSTVTLTVDGGPYSAKSISGSGSFVVPYFSVDTEGRVTSVTNRTITVNSSLTASTYSNYGSYTSYYNYSNYYSYGNYNSYNNLNYGNARPSQCSSLPSQCKPTNNDQTFPNGNYLINNFSETGSTADWNLSGWTLSGSTLIGTGARPNFNTSSFTVGANDIVRVEFTVSLPTPSTTTGGPGIFIGTQYGQSVYVNGFDFNAHQYNISSTIDTNPYFLYGYNSTSTNRIITYIFGYNVSSTTMQTYPASATNQGYGCMAIKLGSGITSTCLRTGYNANSSMVIHLSNVKVYKVN